MMLEMLNPEYRFSSLVKITPAWMCKHNYRALLIDIDNTLLPRNSSVIPENNINWLQMMQLEGIAVVMASNNGGTRTAVIGKQLAEKGLLIPILTWAGKPFPWAYAGAIRLLEESQTANGIDMKNSVSGILAAGDQLFTDVLGASGAGIRSILVRRISFHERYYIHLKRILEYVILLFYPVVRLGRRRDELEEAL